MSFSLNWAVDFAKSFAASLHEDQGQTYDGKPYAVHLDHVVKVLLHFDYTDKALLAAGYLHDAVEDTGLDPSVIFSLFGPQVGTLVMAVTDEPGENRKERKAKTYPKIRGYGNAVVLKLADRIANLEYSLSSGNVRMQKLYKKEFPEFEQNIRTYGQQDPMWLKLQALVGSVP